MIDKQYILGYSVKNDGTLYYPSRLADTYDLNEVRQLPLPNHKHYTIDNENGYYVTKEEVDDVLLNGNLKIFKSILEGDYNSIAFDESVEPNSRYIFLRDLNKHAQTELTTEQINEGLKNRVVDGILDVVLNPKNQINLHIPINMDDPQKAAQKSALGKEEKLRTSDNPASKFVMQEQNMVGKEVIGITAVSLKVYFLLSNYYNTKYRELIDLLKTGKNDEAVELLDRLMFTTRIHNHGIVANINLDPIVKFLKDNQIETITLSNGTVFNIKQQIEQLRDTANVSDASLSISALLSAATDNAKELILAKINASAKFVDIYTHLLITGMSFDQIADIMTSPIFNYVVKVTDGDIFDKSTYKFSIESAINFYLGEHILPYLSETSFFKLIEPFVDRKYFWETVINDANKLEELENNILNNIPKRKSAYLSEDVDEELFAEYSDYSEEFFDEFFDESEEDGVNIISNIKLTKEDYINSYKVVKSFITRKLQLDNISNLQEQLDNLRFIVNKVLPATEEQSILGAMAGINQGIRTNSFDKYNYIKRIEAFVNKRFDQNPNFDLMLFLNDPIKQREYINRYEKVKSTFNILEAITTVPHFKEMFQVLYLDRTAIDSLAAKNYFETKIANELVSPDNKLNAIEYRELSKYINDVFIYNWIQTLDRSIHVPVGQKYFANKFGIVKTNSIEGFEINLNNVENIATFKRLMDEYIIPTLKSDPNFANNLFIKLLTWGTINNPYSDKPNVFYKLPLNMMQIDKSLRNQTLYEAILHDFNLLNGKTFDGWNVIDLFYLYNLVVNKDAFGQRSFTRLFEDITKINSSNLLATQFYSYLSNLDYSMDKSINYDIRDAKYRLGIVTNNPKKLNIERDNDAGIISVNRQEVNLHNIDTSYFTLNMPFLEGNNANLAKNKLVEIKPRTTSYYHQELNSAEILNAITSRLRNIYPESQIQVITDNDINTSDDISIRNSEAFIQDGIVFINIDKASITAPLHEFTHLVLAGIKENSPEVYYNILSSIVTHPKYNEIASNPMYANKHGSDLDEEVFATILGEYFKNKVYEWPENNLLTDTDNITKTVINQVFDINTGDINIQSLMNSSLENLLETFSSGIISGGFTDLVNIEYIKLNQKLATIKNSLISDKTIKEDCYE